MDQFETPMDLAFPDLLSFSMALHVGSRFWSFFGTCCKRLSDWVGDGSWDTYLPISILFNLVVFSSLGNERPMKQEAIDIIQAELLKGVVDTPFHILRLKIMTPYFRRNKNILPLHTRILGQKLPNPSSYLVFVSIPDLSVAAWSGGVFPRRLHPSTVQMSISSIQCRDSSSLHQTGRAILCKRSKSQSGDAFAIVEFEGGGRNWHVCEAFLMIGKTIQELPLLRWLRIEGKMSLE